MLQVDRVIGKNHLFKRSIILIKAWCYHEKNIHGSNKGLLSTYAVEVLILYILNLHHKSVSGPLEVITLQTILSHLQNAEIKIICMYFLCLIGVAQIFGVL
jgi:hypothetical protein